MTSRLPDLPHPQLHSLKSHSDVKTIPAADNEVLQYDMALRQWVPTALSAVGLLHSNLGGVTADQHHAKVHDLAGVDHTVSGLTAGHVIRAAGPSSYGFAQLAHGDLSGAGVGVAGHVTNADTHDHLGGDGAQIDHGGLAGLADDDHTQYALRQARVGIFGMSANHLVGTSWAKVAFDTVVTDQLGGTFSTTNKRFTAGVPGFYRCTVSGYSTTSSTADDRYAIAIYKNGGNYQISGGQYSASDTPLPTFSAVVYLNGTTDYIEIWVFSAITAAWQGSGGAVGHTMAWYIDYLGT